MNQQLNSSMYDECISSIKMFSNHNNLSNNVYYYVDFYKDSENYLDEVVNNFIQTRYNTGIDLSDINNYQPILTEEEKRNIEIYRKANVYEESNRRRIYEDIRNQYFNDFGLYELGIYPVDYSLIRDGINNYQSNLYNYHNNRMGALGYGINPSINNYSYYNNIGTSSYYNQLNPNNKYDYKQGSVNVNFRNGHIPSFQTYGQNNYLYYNNYQNNQQNQLQLIKFIADNIIYNSNNDIIDNNYYHLNDDNSIENTEEFKILKKELSDRYLKWGTSDLDNIEILKNKYNIEETDLGTEKHMKALEEIQKYDNFLIEQQVLIEIESLYIPIIKERYRSNIINYIKSVPDPNMSLEEYQNYLIELSKKDYYKFTKDYIYNKQQEKYNKFIRSEKYENIHGVGLPSQILYGYGSPNSKPLGMMLHEKKYQGEFLNRISDNPINKSINNGILDISLDPKYKEALAVREIRRQLAYDKGKDYHQ